MNTLKQIASRAIVFVLALSVLVPAVVIAGDNNVVQAEKLATLYSNKGTAKTTKLALQHRELILQVDQMFLHCMQL